MDLRTEFKNHERECRRMATTTRDSRSKATWNQMADRWLRAAENQAQVEQQAEAMRRARQPRRVRHHGWFDTASA
jgi:hypothetical protein